LGPDRISSLLHSALRFAEFEEPRFTRVHDLPLRFISGALVAPFSSSRYQANNSLRQDVGRVGVRKDAADSPV